MKLQSKLASNGSKIMKQQILRNIEELEWRTFVYAYHPESIYNMKWANYDVDNLGEPREEMFTLLNDILDKRISGQAAKDAVHEYAEKFGDLIKLVTNKDMRCGVSATLFNFVFPGSIPQFKAMKAQEVPLKDLKYPLLAQLKYDGVRLITTISGPDRDVTFRTYNGKKVNLPMLEMRLKQAHLTNCVLDGEIVYGDGKLEDRGSISGAINSAMHGGRIDETDVVYHVFDFLTREQFETQSSKDPYDIRWDMLRGVIKVIDDPSVQLAITNEVHNAEGAQQLFEGCLAMGYEGLILKHKHHLYEFKRSKNWIKAKAIKTADLTCIGIEDGTGKYEGMIGALKCAGKVDGKDVVVKVGSGLTDMDRAIAPSYYFGQSIEIKYNSVVQDKTTEQWSLFLPRFVKVRTDK